jgi:plastocyanin
MRRRITAFAAGAALGLCTALAAAPGAGAAQPAAEVDAAGNAFSGGLAFIPARISVRVGDVVQWRNTDFLVPHTATEDHFLFNLTGDYGGTPVNPPGFGPGETRRHRFAAGTWNYFCQVHPDDMRGRVTVPPTLRVTARYRLRPKKRKHRCRTRRCRKRRRAQRRPCRTDACRQRRREARLRDRRRRTVVNFTLAGRWAAAPLPAGQAFVVERRRGSGPAVRTETRDLSGRFDAGRKSGVTYRLRVRVRGSRGATGWSPPVRVTTRKDPNRFR